MVLIIKYGLWLNKVVLQDIFRQIIQLYQSKSNLKIKPTTVDER